MTCPLCGGEMLEGGLIVQGLMPPCWVPLDQFSKTGLRSLVHFGARSFGKTNTLLSLTKVPNAFYCEHCGKVMGIFDVTNDSEE